MKEFDYDIHKYMAYRKTHRYEPKNSKIEQVKNNEDKYKGKKLSDGAKRFIQDIIKGVI